MRPLSTFSALVSCSLVVGPAFAEPVVAQPASSPLPETRRGPEAQIPSLPPPAASPEPSAGPPSVAPPPVAAPAPSPTVELTTLRRLRDRGLISDAELESALKELKEIGPRALDGTSLVAGKWAMSLFGFVQADAMYDTTESFNEQAGNNQVARPGDYRGEHDRFQMSARHSRFGLRVKAPEFHGIRASALFEADFLGTQLPVGYGQPNTGSEAASIVNPTFRARHFYLKLETDIVDVVAGQAWNLFNFQPFFQPNTIEIQGVPGQIFGRTPQVRVSKTLHFGGVTLEAAVAAQRAPQRDAGVPEGQAALRFAIDGWKGVHTGGATGTNTVPATLAISGDLRHLRVPELGATPVESRTKDGGAVGAALLLPIVPGSADKRAGGLTLIGEAAYTLGGADLYSALTGGISLAPAAGTGTSAPPVTANIDPGIAAYDASGTLHLIQWTSALAGLEYYLPGLDGRVWVSANYSYLASNNTDEWGIANRARKDLQWFSGYLWADLTPAVRVSVGGAYFRDQYVDGVVAENVRVQGAGWLVF